MTSPRVAPAEDVRTPRSASTTPMPREIIDDAVRRVARDDSEILKALAAFDRGERTTG